MRSRFRSISIVGFVTLLAACQPAGRPVSEATYRAFKGLEGAIGIGVSKLAYDEHLRSAAAELLILADLSADTEDSLALRHYGEALLKYKDAGTLWTEQIDDGRYDWIPEGRIYNTHTDIAARYSLETQSHKMRYSGTTFTTVAATSIQIIWERAGVDSDSAHNVVVNQLRRAR